VTRRIARARTRGIAILTATDALVAAGPNLALGAATSGTRRLTRFPFVDDTIAAEDSTTRRRAHTFERRIALLPFFDIAVAALYRVTVERTLLTAVALLVGIEYAITAVGSHAVASTSVGRVVAVERTVVAFFAHFELSVATTHGWRVARPARRCDAARCSWR
jgi:hypothetical protein